MEEDPLNDDDLFGYASRNGKTRAEQIFQRFKAFHTANPQIWKLYKRFALALLDSGRTHYSSDAVFHRIRWHVDVETKSNDGLKLNDHYVAYYSRMFIAVFPQHEAFFRRRKRPSANHSAYKNDIAVFNTGNADKEAELMRVLRQLGE